MSMIITIDPSCLSFWPIVFAEAIKFLACTCRWEYADEDDKVVFRAFFPAMKMDDVTVDVQGKLLTITKEIKIFEWWFPKKHFEIRPFSKISKTFDLPDGVTLLLGQGDFTTSIKENDDGILNVTVTFNRDNRLETLLSRTIAFLYARMYWEVSGEGKAHVFKAHLPRGMTKQDVDVEISQNKELRIIKPLDIEVGVTMPDWLLHEFSDGKICRRFNLPEALRLSLGFTTPTNNGYELKIEDEMEDGVVTVTVTVPFIDQPKKKKKKKKEGNLNRKLAMSRLRGLLAKAALPKAKLISKFERVFAKTTLRLFPH